MLPSRLKWPVLGFWLTASLPAAAVAAEPCELGPISYIFVDNQSIFDTKSESGRFSWFYRAANSLHMNTRRAVVIRELLFAPGDCYDPFLAEESERLLRAYDFLAQVEVYGLPQPDGTYHVIVTTRDEWSTQADIRIGLRDGIGLEGARLREANLFGRGEALTAYYIQREVTRDYGLRYHTPQLAGTRWDLDVNLGRSRAGTVFSELIAYPFVGEVSRWSARQEFNRQDRFFDYVGGELEDERTHILLPMRDKQFDLSVVARLGHRGNLTLLGGSLTHQKLTYPGVPQVGRRGHIEVRTEADSALIDPALALREELSNIRVGVLVGQRNVWYVKRRGLDAMRGMQDVRLGSEAGISLARSIASLEADNDLYTSFAFASGAEIRDVMIFSRARIDARRDFDAPSGEPEWEDIFGEAEALLYWKPRLFPSHTLLLRGIGAGGWQPRTPFQLTLGGERNLRGYRDERFPGGRRLIGTFEDRMYWGWPKRETLDVGSTLFVDVGRMWSGDAPYGIDSGVRATAGIGLRASFPAGSRTTYRIDLAMPVSGRSGVRDVRLMISVGEQIGLAGPFGDYQIQRSRPQGVIGQLFRLRQ
jgi:hypothetical protein